MRYRDVSRGMFSRGFFKGYLVKHVIPNNKKSSLATQPRDRCDLCRFSMGKSHVPYCVVPFPTVPYYAVPFRTVPYFAVPFPIVPLCALLCRNVLCRGNPHSITELYRTVPYCNIVAPLANPTEYSPTGYRNSRMIFSIHNHSIGIRS